MKKFVLLFVLCVSVLTMAACGGSGGSGNETTTAANETTTAAGGGSSSAADKGYTFTYNGKEIYMHQDAGIIEELGDYKNYTESASCAFEGMDKQYFYGSFYVTTGTLKGEEFISSLWFVDDMVETNEGLCIGDSKDKVEELYGADGFNGTNAYIIKNGGMSLSIILDGETVSSILYNAEF